MDIVRFKGGLGNQMFQYAFYEALKARKRQAKASLGFYHKHPEARCFCLTETFPGITLDCISDQDFDRIDMTWREIKQDVIKLEKFRRDYRNRFFWVEDDSGSYHPEVYQTQNCTFVGYWQSEKYFYDIKETLLKKFDFPFGEENLQIWKKSLLENGSYVSVHIRRNDYLKYTQVYGNISESPYYRKAMDYIAEKISFPRFLFFSDDITWVKEHYQYEDAIYVDEHMFEDYKPWYDMCLMSCCAHNIIANSSFSWWGAWLNRNEDKIVIAPGKWFFDKQSGEDICPDCWERISIT